MTTATTKKNTARKITAAQRRTVADIIADLNANAASLYLLDTGVVMFRTTNGANEKAYGTVKIRGGIEFIHRVDNGTVVGDAVLHANRNGWTIIDTGVVELISEDTVFTMPTNDDGSHAPCKMPNCDAHDYTYVDADHSECTICYAQYRWTN